MTIGSIDCCAVKPDDWFCPIFKEICFRDMVETPGRLEFSRDRCPCGMFNLDVTKDANL